MIVHEAALRQVVGNSKVMAAQLRAMLQAAELPNVRLWVVPLKLAGNAGFVTAFYVMNFSRNKSVVYMENMTTGVYLEDAEKIDYFRHQASELAKAALDPARSAAFVGVGRPLARCRRAALFPRPPTRTRRASFPAPGSPVTVP
jgi:hypothetical protein